MASSVRTSRPALTLGIPANVLVSRPIEWVVVSGTATLTMASDGRTVTVRTGSGVVRCRDQQVPTTNFDISVELGT